MKAANELTDRQSRQSKIGQKAITPMPSIKTIITVAVIAALVFVGLKKFGSKIPLVGEWLD
ncbi:MAG: hypothetical protein PHY43_03925 [Verrucomicrobiales bacterium]|nr:hypothetical protein [Verrucomicrobiales bacterium]